MCVSVSVTVCEFVTAWCVSVPVSVAGPRPGHGMPQRPRH